MSETSGMELREAALKATGWRFQSRVIFEQTHYEYMGII